MVPGRADPAARRAELSAGARGPRICCGSPTPRATCSASARPGPSITSSPVDGSRRPISPDRGRSPRRSCRKTSRRSRSSTNARACSRRCPGTDQAIEAVVLAQIPQTARVDRTKIEAPPVELQRRAGVHGDRRHLAAARASTPTRTSSCSAASTTTAARACGSPARPPTGRGRSRRPSRPRSTRSPRARRRITSPTWSSKRMTTTTTSGSRSRMPPVTRG